MVRPSTRACTLPTKCSSIAFSVARLAQEQGAATDRYQKYVEDMIDDLTFANKAKIAKDQDGVTIRSKEHLNYYAIFRSYFPPPKEEDCKARCPQCRGCMQPEGRFCRTCGAFPVTPLF